MSTSSSSPPGGLAGLRDALMLIMGALFLVGVVAGWVDGHRWNWYLGGSRPTEWPVVVTVGPGEVAELGHFDLYQGAGLNRPLGYAVCSADGVNPYLLLHYGQQRYQKLAEWKLDEFNFFPSRGWERFSHGDFDLSVEATGRFTLVVGVVDRTTPITRLRTSAELFEKCPPASWGALTARGMRAKLAQEEALLAKAKAKAEAKAGKKEGEEAQADPPAAQPPPAVEAPVVAPSEESPAAEGASTPEATPSQDDESWRLVAALSFGAIASALVMFAAIWWHLARKGASKAP